ncbi:MAG: hypothetical protein HYX78_10820 [Armatimonadetes bacterium]|nr:hypothetical protein [Armatimonadota bacterium]
MRVSVSRHLTKTAFSRASDAYGSFGRETLESEVRRHVEWLLYQTIQDPKFVDEMIGWRQAQMLIDGGCKMN